MNEHLTLENENKHACKFWKGHAEEKIGKIP
jgi:hypothetical protein